MNNSNQIEVHDTARCLIACAIVLCAATVVVETQAESPPPITWIRQIGTSGYEYSNSVATDVGGNLFITGSTGGSLGGPNAGSDDVFVSKYDTAGNLAWTRQIGTSSSDGSTSVATDTAGSVFITGSTYGSLGGPNAGAIDAFVSKYTPAGNLAWTRQLGTSSADYSQCVAIDTAGNLFITGYTLGSLGGPSAGSFDVFVCKYDAAGNLAWTHQFGTSSADYSFGVTIDTAGNLVITGSTGGSLGGTNAGNKDAFVRKYDTSGNIAWTRQIGTLSQDLSYGVATDAMGNVFIIGATSGSLGGPFVGGEGDAFVSKYDPAGNLAWTRQVGTTDSDRGFGVATDVAGNVFITGETFGSLGGTNAGGNDAFVSKYDPAGNLAWTCQLGSSSWDDSRDVATDAAGNLFITGTTGGNLGGTNAGNYDAFIIKFSSITSLGDANNDQQINLADLQILGDHWQACGANWSMGDFNGDGLVNLADLQVLGDNWGYGVGADVAFDEALQLVGLNVPEPAALALLPAAVGAGVGVRRSSAC